MSGKQIMHSVNYFGDMCACGWYRMGWPSNILKTQIGGEYQFQTTDTEALIPDAQFYALTAGGVKLVRIQRWFRI